MRLTGREWQRNKVEPYPESKMVDEDMPETICGVLREIYQKTSDSEVKLLARIGVSMAKKIASKLNYYHNKYES